MNSKLSTVSDLESLEKVEEQSKRSFLPCIPIARVSEYQHTFETNSDQGLKNKVGKSQREEVGLSLVDNVRKNSIADLFGGNWRTN